MSEEIKKEVQDVELMPEELEGVSGGTDGRKLMAKVEVQGGVYTVYDCATNSVLGTFVRGVCSRCGRTFSGREEILNHIKEWLLQGIL